MQHFSIRPRLSTVIMALSLLLAPVSAQVTGIVLDTAGAPVADALVTLKATSTQTTTASNGTFTLPGLAGPNLRIVAGKKGYFNEGLTVTAPAFGVLVTLESVPASNDPSYGLLDPNVCGGCHPQALAEWTGSRMAHAGQNLWVYDIYDGTGTTGGMGGFVYTTGSVHAAANPASECKSCHQPEPWIAQPFTALEPIGALSQGALNGVSCEICHKVADIDLAKTDFPGIHPSSVTFTRPTQPLLTHQVEYGTYPDADYEAPGLMRPSYQPQLEAAVCAACHQDKNDPDGNGNFAEPNGIVSEPTWDEWLSSPYGNPADPNYATCVDCHMPPNGQTTVCVVQPVQRDPSQVRTHDVEGTSPAFLENAADLTVSVQPTSTELQVTVDVTNSHAGHALPTGVTIRNMILLVEAWRVEDGQKLVDTGTQTIHPLGGVGDPAQGYYAGLPGKLFAKHNLDANGNGPTFFTDATSILFDNRIPALATDTTNYTFQLPPGGGTFKVRARLIYRRSFRFLTDAKNWTVDGHGDPLEDIQAPYFGHLMEETTWASPGAQAVSTFGSGCNGLSASWSGEPTIGSSNFQVTLSGAQPSATAILLLGNSNTQWGAIGLPLDLTAVGAPGCALLVSPDMSYVLGADGFGQASLDFTVPFIPAFAGTTFYAQWLASDTASSIGWSFSNGLSITSEP